VSDHLQDSTVYDLLGTGDLCLSPGHLVRYPELRFLTDLFVSVFTVQERNQITKAIKIRNRHLSDISVKLKEK